MSESMEQNNESKNTISPKHQVSQHNTSKTTQGGELPSYDHDKYPAGTVQVASEKETTQLPEAGKSVSPSNHASNVPLKECRTVKSGRNREGRNGRRPPLEKSQNSRQWSKNKERSSSRFRYRSRSRSRSRSKFSFRSRNVSSTHRAVTSATRRTYHAKNGITMDKGQGFEKHVRTQNSNFHSRKVQDLRQIIAVRENKKKFEGGQQNTGINSDSYRDQESNNPQVYSVKQPCGANDGTKRITESSLRNRMTELADAFEQVATEQAKTLHIRTIEVENLKNESFWNSWNNKKMDLDSLLELEESVEKEMDEAQELRRSCEIQELDSLRAYRNAQRALIDANAKCYHLKLEGSINRDPFQSLLMVNSNSIWRNYAADESKTIFGLPDSTHFEASLKSQLFTKPGSIKKNLQLQTWRI